MTKNRVVWEDGKGDLRKAKAEPSSVQSQFTSQNILVTVRRLTAGKGRAVIEIAQLPKNEDWCQQLAKDLKQKLGAGGTYKQGYIEIHVDKVEMVTKILDAKAIRWKKTGG